MKTTIDKFGRIVVPKEIRKHFGLVPGTQVEIGGHNREIVIRQITTRSPLQIEDGLLVFDGEATGDITSWVHKAREDRNLKISSSI